MDFFVDIPICAYNHEKYIAQAIDGVVMQKTNFKFRLFIGEDASSDNTRSIIIEYSLKYPNIIFPILHDINIGATENSKILLSKCTSKYIALCDGDDYWTDQDKLQKQIDFLEANPDYVACFHDADFIFNGLVTDKFSHRYGSIYKYNPFSYEDVVCFDWFIPTASLMFRNVLKVFPEWFNNIYSGDRALHIMLAQKGKIFYINESMACYRIHSGGISQQTIPLEKIEKGIYQYRVFLKEFGGWPKMEFHRALIYYYYKRARYRLLLKNISGFVFDLASCLRSIINFLFLLIFNLHRYRRGKYLKTLFNN